VITGHLRTGSHLWIGFSWKCKSGSDRWQLGHCRGNLSGSKLRLLCQRVEESPRRPFHLCALSQGRGVQRSTLKKCQSLFFRELRRAISGERIRGRRLRDKIGCRRFWRWSSRESAWPISKLILAMGGTLGPAPKAMQLSQPSLLSYLHRFNQKRRVHYKIHVQPRWRSDAPSPRLRAPTKVQRPTVTEELPVV
jgi:hypothetical protein